jgi:separase
MQIQITLKDFGDDQCVDNAPLLYHSLMGYPSPLPKKLIGLILEQVSECFVKINNGVSVFLISF